MFKRAGQCLTVAFSLAATALAISAVALPAPANVVREDQPTLVKDVPIYRWHDDLKPTRGVCIAVHGLTMHGGVFDTMARRLAAHGFIVYAPDLRGYGRWQSIGNKSDGKAQQPIDYEGSYSDLVNIVKLTKERYPQLPTFCIGESLGADLVLRASGDMPEAFDGIVLASPALKLHSFFWDKVKLSGPSIANPWRQIDVARYIKKWASDDPNVADGALNDPLVRKGLSPIELYRTLAACKPALDYAKKVPESLPVLVIQGSDDRMVQSKAVIKLLSQLKSTDQTVRWFRDRGHLLLETSYIRQDTLETVDQWLSQRLRKVELVRSFADSQAPIIDMLQMSTPVAEDLTQTATIASQH